MKSEDFERDEAAEPGLRRQCVWPCCVRTIFGHAPSSP